MKSHNPKMYADRDLTMEEMAVQQSILTKDPVYAAMADELYENITGETFVKADVSSIEVRIQDNVAAYFNK